MDFGEAAASVKFDPKANTPVEESTEEPDDDDDVIIKGQALLDPKTFATDVVTWGDGTQNGGGGGDPNIKPKPNSKPYITVPVADDPSVPSNLSTNKTVITVPRTNPRNVTGPGEAAPNVLKLNGVKDILVEKFLPSYKNILKVVQNLKSKKIPGEKKLSSGIDTMFKRAQRAIDIRLRAALKALNKSKGTAIDKRSQYQTEIESAVSKAKTEITNYVQSVRTQISDLMKIVDQSDLFTKVTEMLSTNTQRTGDALERLSKMPSLTQNKINSLFANAAKVIDDRI